MRDIDRIDNFCAMLAAEWKRYPDFRFGQFILNVLGEIQAEHGDIWYIEEDKMAFYIKEAMDSIVGK